VTFTVSSSAGNADVVLLNGSRALKAGEADSAGVAEISKALLPGRYEIAVMSSDPTPTKYRVKVTTAPVASPSRVEVIPFGGNGAQIRWLDNADNETGYAIQQVIDGHFRTISTTPANSTAAAIEGLATGSTNQFRVVAQSALGTASSINASLAITSSVTTQSRYKVKSVTYRGKGEAGWTMKSQNFSIKPAFQNSWFEASSWENAVIQAVQGSIAITKSDGQDVTHTFGQQGMFAVGSTDEMRTSISGFDIPSDAGKLITVEDSYGDIDRDYDDFYFEVDVEQEALVVGFYGADINDPATNPNIGNQYMQSLAGALNSEMFASQGVDNAFDHMLSTLDADSDGKYDPSAGDVRRDIVLYGHSWGGHQQFFWPVNSMTAANSSWGQRQWT